MDVGLHKQRWMLFVDGENFTIRAESLAKGSRIELKAGSHYLPGVFVWPPGIRPEATALVSHSTLQAVALRATYYTSLSGDDLLLTDVKERLWRLGFNPQVFKKDKQQQKSKGVDVTLTKDVLSHAFLGNYDAVVLIAGDGDYVPLVEEVKRLGKVVYLAFFKNDGLYPELRRSSDTFVDISE